MSKLYRKIKFIDQESSAQYLCEHHDVYKVVHGGELGVTGRGQGGEAQVPHLGTSAQPSLQPQQTNNKGIYGK